MNTSFQEIDQIDLSQEKMGLRQVIQDARDQEKNSNQQQKYLQKIKQMEQQVDDLTRQKNHWQEMYKRVIEGNLDHGQQSESIDSPELQQKIKTLLEKYNLKQQLLIEKEQKIIVLEESVLKQKQEFDEELQQMMQQNEILMKKYDKLSKAFIQLNNSRNSERGQRSSSVFLNESKKDASSLDQNINAKQSAHFQQSNLDFSIQIDQTLKYKGDKDDYRQLETEMNLIKQTLLKCKRQNVELQKSNAQYQKQFESMDLAKLEMESKLSHQEKKLMQTQEYLRKMEREYGQDRQTVQKLNQQIKLLQNLNEELQIANEQEQLDSQGLNQKITKITQEYQKLQNLEIQYVDLQGEFQQLQQDYDQKCHHNSRMFEKIKEIEAQNQEYFDKIEIIEQQCSEIKLYVSPIEFEKNDLKNKNIELMRQIEQNYSDKQSLEYKIREISQQNVQAVNAMKVALEEKEFYKTNFQSLQLKVESIQKKFEAEKMSISFSESQVMQKDHQLKIEMESLKQKVDHLQSILEQKQIVSKVIPYTMFSSVLVLGTTIEFLGKQSGGQSQICSSIYHSINQNVNRSKFIEKYSQIDINLQFISLAIIILQDIEQWRQNSNDIENQLKNERVQFQQQIDELKKNNTNLGLKRLQDDSQEMKKYIETKYQLELIQSENEKLNQVNELLYQQNNQFIEELNELRPQLIKLTEDLRYSNEKLSIEQDQHQFCASENHNLKIEFESLNEKYLDLQDSFQAKYVALQQQLDQLTRYNQNIEAHLEKVNHQYEKYNI